VPVGTILGVTIAGALGALARYGIGGWLAGRSASAFPWETLVINVSGSFLLGLVFVVLTERVAAAPSVRASLMVGFLGAYTTFSTFGLETMRLVEEGSIWLAALNVLASVLAALLAVWVGMAIGRAV
jgi:CrcB protein